jgi:signal transduction histidine kinase
MSHLRRLIRSFTFRLLFITMVMFFATMLVTRIVMYHATIDEAIEDVQTIVSEQFLQIDRGITTRGYQHGLNLIAASLSFDVENMFALSYMDRDGVIREGNLTGWPDVALQEEEEEWFTFRVTSVVEDSVLSKADDVTLSSWIPLTRRNDIEVRHFIARVHEYPNGAKLLVGYDLRQVNRMRSLLFDVVIENTIISVVAAFLCSVLIAYWINRRLRTINRTCKNVMSGDLDDRATSSGGNDEFDQLAQNLNAMLAWISQLVSSIKDATNALAHDMRTPLSRHKIHLTQMLDRKDMPATSRELLQQAVDEVDRIVELYDAILNISRAESRATVENFSQFNVHALLTDVVELYETFAEQKHITLKLVCDPAMPITGERQLIAQAVYNLVDNALKYSPEHTEILVSCTAQEKGVEICVRDQGPGIPEEEYERVKERFYRLDKSRSTPGTGLGLSLVNAVMHLHRGRFWLENAQPGLRANLLFPA